MLINISPVIKEKWTVRKRATTSLKCQHLNKHSNISHSTTVSIQFLPFAEHHFDVTTTSMSEHERPASNTTGPRQPEELILQISAANLTRRDRISGLSRNKNTGPGVINCSGRDRAPERMAEVGCKRGRQRSRLCGVIDSPQAQR